MRPQEKVSLGIFLFCPLIFTLIFTLCNQTSNSKKKEHFLDMHRSIGIALSFLLTLLVLPIGAEQASLTQESTLSLAEAIRQVQALSPIRRAAQARAEAAEGALHQASRLPNPLIDLREENLSLSGGTRGPIDQTVDVFALVSQPIEIGGKRTARKAAAAADVVAARAGIQQAERELTIETVRFYLTALQAHALTAILTANRSDLQTLVDTMQRRVAEGYAAEADLMKFRAEAARLDTELVRARLEFERSAAALGSLLAISGPLIGSRLVEPELLDPPMGNPAELSLQAVEKRPELIAARARLERARHALDLERARRLPDVALTAGYKRTEGDNTLVAGFMVPLPLFDQNTGNIERAIADERAAALDLDALTRKLTAETTSLILAAQQLTERARRIEQQLVQPAEIVRNAARSSFREGATNILQLIDAERVYTEARRGVLALKLEAYEKTFEARLTVLGEETP